jgi:hypothetical protein
MDKLRNSRWFSLMIVLTAPFLLLMDIFIVNIVIPLVRNAAAPIVHYGIY